MSPLPKLTAREAEQRLLRAGFIQSRQKGSHKIYRKGSFRMVLPWHQGKILHPKIVKELVEIIREAEQSEQ
jgi:predicted RNA binding protein YcfA (HicA-like mRNA interferase family)